MVLWVIGGVLLWRNQPDNLVQDASITADKTSSNKQLGTVEGRYLFSGTIVLARAVERDAHGDYNQPFSQLDSFEPSKYDGWLADLECPVTTKNVSYQEAIDTLKFNCKPEWLPALGKYFNLINLANNHTGDMGSAGFIETQKHLGDAGIQTVGSVDPSSREDACEVMALPVRVTLNGARETKGTLPVAFCAFHYFFRRPLTGEMDIVKEFSKVMPTFGLMHVGVEYLPKAGIEQRDVAHTLIDNGTEFVIGNSPHWVQDAEVYKGKPIFYSTGNLIFDQLDTETNRGLNMDVAFTVQYDDNVAKWLALGESCKTRRDDCLNKAAEQKLTKVNMKFTYEPIASSGGVRQITHRSTQAVQKAVEERLGWTQIKQVLGQQ